MHRRSTASCASKASSSRWSPYRSGWAARLAGTRTTPYISRSRPSIACTDPATASPCSAVPSQAVVLATAGGALGVALGALVTMLLGRAFELSMHITPAYVVLSLTVSSVVGIVSGWYPASRAAKLDPVVALRAE